MTCSILPGTVWISGVSASGKTTLATVLYKDLTALGINNVELLDGEDLRSKFDRSYGHSIEERYDVLKKIVQIANQSNSNGNLAIVATISSFRDMREYARQEIFNFMEVCLICPVNVCSERDYKGHYHKALQGHYDTFIGVTHPYEKSESPELTLHTHTDSIDSCSKRLLVATLEKFSGDGEA